MMKVLTRNKLLILSILCLFIGVACGGGGSSSDIATSSSDGSNSSPEWIGTWSQVSIDGVPIASLGITSYIFTATESAWSYTLLTAGTTCTASGTWEVDVTDGSGSVTYVTESSSGPCTNSVKQKDIGTVEFTDGGNTMIVTITSGNSPTTSVYIKV